MGATTKAKKSNLDIFLTGYVNQMGHVLEQ